MQVLGVTGPSNSGKTTTVERLTERLAEKGRVGTIKHIDCEPTLDTAGKDTLRHRDAGAVRTYGIAESQWFATGETHSLEDALDELAPVCEYALVEGYRGSGLPVVVLGEESRPNAVAHAPTVEALDIDAVVESLESTDPYETLSSLVERVKQSAGADRAGAIATFTGRVRAKDSPDDDPTEYLEFERYDTVAAERMATIIDELESREGVYEVQLHHRTGVIESGEDIVFVVVLAGHRTEAFRAVEDGINRLKAEVPLFKKEVTVEDEFWAHQR